MPQRRVNVRRAPLTKAGEVLRCVSVVAEKLGSSSAGQGAGECVRVS